MVRPLMLTCVRHGRTAWNEAGRFQGHTDVPLDELGREQARATGLRLESETFAYAVASDLVRASETARLILGDRPVILRLDAQWREMSFGDWEGLTWAQIEQRFPQGQLEPAATVRTFTAPGGESFDALCARIEAALAQVRASVPEDASVLIVTHAGPIHALIRVLDVSVSEGALGVKILPAGISRFAQVRGRWEICCLNSVAGPIDRAPAGIPDYGP